MSNMIIEIILLILGLVIGFILANYAISKQKWGDKSQAINEKWKRELAETQKDYEIKLEKANSETEKIREENKTSIEKLLKEWQVKYIKDIEELKMLFKTSEKTIREKSVSSSRRSLVGKFIEKFVPFLSKIPYAPSDMHFLGQPIDYIVFDGLHEDKVKRVVFLEVKTGESKLTKREKSLKDAIEGRRVSWKELRVDTSEKGTPDKEMENEESGIDELYNAIDDKIKKIKETPLPKVTINKHQKRCPKCGRSFTLELDKGDDLKAGVHVTCPACKKPIIVH